MPPTTEPADPDYGDPYDVARAYAHEEGTRLGLLSRELLELRRRFEKAKAVADHADKHFRMRQVVPYEMSALLTEYNQIEAGRDG